MIPMPTDRDKAMRVAREVIRLGGSAATGGLYSAAVTTAELLARALIEAELREAQLTETRDKAWRERDSYANSGFERQLADARYDLAAALERLQEMQPVVDAAMEYSDDGSCANTLHYACEKYEAIVKARC